MDVKNLNEEREYKFVSVVPKGTEDHTSKRLGILQQAERASWTGIKSELIGIPGQGLNNPNSLPEFSNQFFQKCKYALEKLSGAYTPPLITFAPVGKTELLKEGPPSSSYSKGNFMNHKDLLYRVFKVDARLVRSTLENSGFCYTDSHDWNVMWIGQSGHRYLYESLNEHQRINHFPSSHEITRKDKLALSILKMQKKFGKEEFDFYPDTYVLPEEFSEFYMHFNKSRDPYWILKPVNSSQGKGINLIDNLTQVPTNEPFVISKYIKNPLLINGLKFDLRLYVLITSFEPLKIYLYQEGLVRFASEEYDSQNKNKYVHLTNYSINKKNKRFVSNKDWREDDFGHKWSLQALSRHLKSAGVDMELFWSKVYDLIIKTVLSMEDVVVDSVRKLSLHRSNCFDLLGFDILIDSNLKPWLIEVNLSPSLATDSPIDHHIKSNLIADTLNLVGIRQYDRKRTSGSMARQRLRTRQSQFSSTSPKSNCYVMRSHIIKNNQVKNNKSQEILKETLEEILRRGNFILVFPAKGSAFYEQYFKVRRMTNLSLYKSLFKEIAKSELPQTLPEVSPKRPRSTVTNAPKPPPANKSFEAISKRTCISCGNLIRSCSCVSKNSGRITITAEDVLIEYVSRLVQALQALRQKGLKSEWRQAIDSFVDNKYWEDQVKGSVTQKMQSRLQTLKNSTKETYSFFKEQKQAAMKGFSGLKLETLLRNSSNSIVTDLAGGLFRQNAGVLTQIVRSLATSAVYSHKKTQSFFGSFARPFTSY